MSFLFLTSMITQRHQLLFFNSKKQLVYYSGVVSGQKINSWLFHYSHLYRAYLGLKIKRANPKREAIDPVSQEMKKNLQELANLLNAQGITFTVLIHPYYVHSSQLKLLQQEMRSKIIQILKDLNIHYFDLAEAIDQTVDAGISTASLVREPDHPNEKGGDVFAKYLYQKGLFELKAKNTH